jgi:hypothetical protein
LGWTPPVGAQREEAGVSDLLTWSAGLPEVTHLAGSVVLQEGVVHGLLFVLVDGASRCPGWELRSRSSTTRVRSSAR